MSDTSGERGIDSDTSPALNWEVFRTRAAARGACTDMARAELAGISRSTLNRLRSGAVKPNLATARRMADRLETTVDVLFPGRARP